MINLAKCTFDQNLPGAFFSSARTYLGSHSERREYESAVRAFAIEASPTAISNAIKAAHRRGFRLTKADAREAAVAGLRDRLLALPGYSETDVQWHAVRRGRRERHFYA
ncbi:hypothetical protein [Bradyrhizobium sp. CCBAU 51765]|uniref:hypothetical protein n=1 Tax=Bradyrhizobium sp. CCBAU 51765 TaxID=1325102 RepID=UPI001887FB0E|nr:hypothetical protein [Bradyrhizobium sp. CCBAU 51765]QOZ09244.1 hypothetical protein XH96_18190 [Bradyrhizobium sp. CCBAU 51765]